MSAKKRRGNSPPDLDLGNLPVDQINDALDLELEEGRVIFTTAAQIHAERNHPGDYPWVSPFVAQVVTSPLYIGDDFKNPGRIELVSRVPSRGAGVLVAVEVSPDRDGNYHICSAYPVSEKKIENRRQKGRLKSFK